MQLKIQINEKQGVNPSTQHEAVKNQHARHNITFEKYDFLPINLKNLI